MRYSPEALEQIDGLYADRALEQLADRVDDLLDELEANPGAAHLRRHQLRQPRASQGTPFWFFNVAGSGQHWRIIWNLDADNEPHIYYVGPEWKDA
ncbi:hypothetical protein [Nocardioides sp.]|uniref:hypothetical protein n=1 Tax=Nocardioides sp. TaxID=35761 RepID=UPI0019A0580C|nr:hypothetical protein [Nocardioides sp.]MBC7279220.1 hypothetical protein [Nocardioides sp.]